MSALYSRHQERSSCPRPRDPRSTRRKDHPPPGRTGCRDPGPGATRGPGKRARQPCPDMVAPDLTWLSASGMRRSGRREPCCCPPGADRCSARICADQSRVARRGGF